MNNSMSFMPRTLMPSARIAPAFAAAIALAGGGAVFAQDRIYRCSGNEYTNNAATAAERGCKLVEGGNLTVVSVPRRATGSPSAPAEQRVANAPQAGTTAAPVGGSRIDTAEQRSRDSDARAILESELKKVEAKQADLLKEFNGGEPEKRGDEMRNNQRYLDRTAEMKAQIARNDSDIAGIKREIGRVQPTAASR